MKAKKNLGQNFLTEDTIIKKIVSLLNCNKDDLVIEIGPGRGALTKYLNNLNSHVICFEIDKDMKLYLDKYNNCEVYYEDILNVDLKKYIEGYKNIYVIGNLPYYITSPIINKLVNSRINFNEMIFMVQNEVADRLSSKEGSSNYGYSTVYINHFYDVKKEFVVKKEYFDPIPKVDSAIIRLTNKHIKEDFDFSKYNRFLKDIFMYKRKNIKNNLKNYDLNVINKVLNNYDLSINSRAEECSEKVLIDIFKNILK